MLQRLVETGKRGCKIKRNLVVITLVARKLEDGARGTAP